MNYTFLGEERGEKREERLLCISISAHYLILKLLVTPMLVDMGKKARLGWLKGREFCVKLGEWFF
jgi:hypothetical protein